jgi:hypothetical protein
MIKYGGAFWVGYVFMRVAFFGQLACAFIAFKTNKMDKFFCNIPLLSISYSGLIVMLIAGTACIVIPDLPNWIGILVCTLILAINVIAIIKAAAASAVVSGIDEKIKEKTAFIKNLSIDAQCLVTSAKTDELRREAEKVYEAIRYSDPMSDSALADLDAKIERQFDAFEAAIKVEDLELAKEVSSALFEVIERRNQKIKLLK